MNGPWADRARRLLRALRQQGAAVLRLAPGDWGPTVRDPIDVLRISLLIGAFAMSVTGDFRAALRMAGTFLVVLAARALEPPRLIDLGFTLGMALQGWGNALDLFHAWGEYNKVVHFVLPFGTAGLLYVALARLDVVSDLESRCHPRQQAGIVLATFTLGFTAGGLYEIWEWAIHHGLGSQIMVGYTDTITDMIDNGLGSLASGWVLMAWAQRGLGPRRRRRDPGTRAKRATAAPAG